ncbi:MAG: hypothetical protein L0Z62_42835 [Gemmataceae bacterium]|nr:hypothetical protein [Gemmataceae bacterium]
MSTKRLLGVLPVLTLLAGCGGSQTLVPVEGKVLVEGKPLTRGTVVLWPDKAKGNTTSAQPTGVVEHDGRFKLTTAGRAGVPPGWYRVTAAPPTPPAADPSLPLPRNPARAAAPARPFNARYEDPAKTDLLIEVSPTPPAEGYALKMKR